MSTATAASPNPSISFLGAARPHEEPLDGRALAQEPQTTSFDDDAYETTDYPQQAQLHNPNEVSFSFSEADLIPSRPDWPLPMPDVYTDQILDSGLSKSSALRCGSSPDLPSDPKITVSRALLVSEPHDADTTDTSSKILEYEERVSSLKNRGISQTFTNLGRKSKATRTASRSPEKKRPEDPANFANMVAAQLSDQSQRPTGSSSSSKSAKRCSVPARTEPIQKEERSFKESVTRSRSLLGRRSRRSSLGPYTNLPSSGSPPKYASPKARPSSPLTKSFSNTSLPTLHSADRTTPIVPPLPGTLNTERVPQRCVSPGHGKKDELWGVFRTMDGDFQR